MFKFLKRRKLRKLIAEVEIIESKQNRPNRSLYDNVADLYDVVSRAPVTAYNDFGLYSMLEEQVMFKSSHDAADKLMLLIDHKSLDVINTLPEEFPSSWHILQWFSNAQSLDIYFEYLHRLMFYYINYVKLTEGMYRDASEKMLYSKIEKQYWELEPVLSSYVMRHLFSDYLFFYRVMLSSELSRV